MILTTECELYLKVGNYYIFVWNKNNLVTSKNPMTRNLMSKQEFRYFCPSFSVLIDAISP